MYSSATVNRLSSSIRRRDVVATLKMTFRLNTHTSNKKEKERESDRVAHACVVVVLYGTVDSAVVDAAAALAAAANE